MITDTYNALLLKGLAAASRDDLLAWGERQGVVFAPGLDPVAVCAALYRTRLRIADSLATSDGVEGEARERYIAAVLEAPHAVVHGKTMSPIDWAAIGREAAR